MDATSKRWTTVTDSPHDHEREALAFLRRRLPDRDPYRVWSNFEFTAPNGKLYEVDALAVTDNGVHLIEIKSHPGQIGGDGSVWQWTTPEGRRHTFDSPRILANSKAKALRSVLNQSKAFAGHRGEVPYIAEVVFLSDPDLKVTLSVPGRHQVFGRDPEPGADIPAARRAIGGIVAALTSLDPDPSRRPRQRIDRPTGARIALAVEQAGIRERAGRRRFGDYAIAGLLADVDADSDTGVAYQDFLVEHQGLPGLRRRLRLYPLELNATGEQREAASRAARREFQHLHALRHPGILGPVEFFEHERGPCLLFEYDPGSQPLDRWLLDPPSDIDAFDRLEIVRHVAEALGHAHGNGVFHRALCPSAVLVAGGHGNLQVQVANWHAGARIGTGDAAGAVTGTEHIDALAAGDAVLYRAPEHALPLAQPAPLDVFSLGCLACAAFTGRPPAPTAGKLRELLAAAGHVAVEAVGDGFDDLLAGLIADLTDSDPARRTPDIAGVLELLDLVEGDWTAPEPEPGEPHVMSARSGATLMHGRFQVAGRLGMGSTAFALLVSDAAADGRIGVLKVAREQRFNPRIDAEAGALAAVDHPAIVKLFDGPLEIDGHRALLLSYVGSRDDAGPREGQTLTARIGTFDADITERMGKDLLDAVAHLEEVGVAHRDIKPENLGIAPRGRGDALHLVLFDFSLAATPIDRLDAGTPGYVDPFLRRPDRGRWDPAAERYSAAVVLYELCTGVKPIYGDGRADPALVDAPLRLDAALFDASVADGLVAFFRRALAPDVDDRHGTATDMLRAWHAAFDAGRLPSTPTDHGSEEPADFVVPTGTEPATPLAALPLSARAVAALERVDILTVADVLGEPLNRLRQLRGVGGAVRAELVMAVALLREHLADSGEADEDAPLVTLARRLIRRTAPPGEVALLRAWLGLDGGDAWPGTDALAPAHGGSERVAEVLAGARERWARRNPPIRAVRDWIAAELDSMAGLATAGQLAARLARARPPAGSELLTVDGENERAAVAVVRAAVVAEAEMVAPRWVRRVLDGPVVVALDPAGGPGGNRLADYASALAAKTTALVTAGPDPVIARSALVGALREIDPPAGARPLADAALAELAAAACPFAAVNTRLELYRQGLPAGAALRAARRAFVAASFLTPTELATKVAARFPAAEALPGRPALDELVVAAGLDLQWRPEKGAYVAPQPVPAGGTSGTTAGRSSSSSHAGLTPVEVDVSADFDDRLRRALGAGGLLVLVAHRRQLEEATGELGRFPDVVVDLDDWLLDELSRLTEGGRPSWDLVVEADAAGPGTATWANLAKVVDRALASLTTRLATTAGTVLVTRCGLLGRYKRLETVARWREAVHDPSTPLEGLWMLVPASPTAAGPMVGGEAVPVLPHEWARIPPDWLRRARGIHHRAGPPM